MKSLTIIAGFICATAVSSLLLACQPKAGPDTNHPGGQTPPVPEKGTLELKLPEAPAQALARPINEQDDTHFQYALSIGQEPVTGKFSGSGQVTKAEERLINLQLKEGKELNVAYKLPGKESKLLLAPKQELAVEQDENFDGPGMNRQFTLQSGKATIVAAGRQSGAAPLAIAVSANIAIRQSAYSEKQVLVESERDTHYGVPLAVVAGGRTLKVPADGKPFAFQDGDFSYELRVLSNGYMQAQKDFEDAAEGGGYYLDYWLLRTK